MSGTRDSTLHDIGLEICTGNKRTAVLVMYVNSRAKSAPVTRAGVVAAVQSVQSPHHIPTGPEEHQEELQSRQAPCDSRSVRQNRLIKSKKLTSFKELTL